MAAVNQSSEDHVYPCSGRRYVTMRMLHALFMLVAMAVAMPTALFLSRYPKSKQCSTVYVGLRVRHIAYYSTSIPLIHAHEHIRFVAKKSKFMHKYIYICIKSIIINTININTIDTIMLRYSFICLLLICIYDHSSCVYHVFNIGLILCLIMRISHIAYIMFYVCSIKAYRILL